MESTTHLCEQYMQCAYIFNRIIIIALLIIITSAYVYGMQEEPRWNQGRNGRPQ